MIYIRYICLTLLLATLWGCGNRTMEQIPSLVAQMEAEGVLWAEVPDSVAAEVRYGTVYIDRSESIRPYAIAGGDGFVHLIELLDAQLLGRMYGFGYKSRMEPQTVSPFSAIEAKQPNSYTYLNNDFGSLFAAIADSGRGVHYIVTDGVQSDAQNNAEYRAIVEGLGDWLSKGNTFGVYVFRTSYRGPYFSERGGPGRVEYACEDRPIVLFAFLPSSGAAQRLQNYFEGLDLNPAYSLVLGGDIPSVALQTNLQFGDTLRMKSLSNEQFYRPDSRRPILIGRAVEREGRLNLGATHPVLVQGAPWTYLSAAQKQRILSNVELDLKTFSVGNLRRADSMRTLTPIVLDPRITNRVDTLSGVALHSHVIAAPPEERGHVVWVGRYTLNPVGAFATVPETLSTRDDRLPEACSQIFNLSQTLGSLVEEYLVLGQFVAVTQH